MTHYFTARAVDFCANRRRWRPCYSLINHVGAYQSATSAAMNLTLGSSVCAIPKMKPQVKKFSFRNSQNENVKLKNLHSTFVKKRISFLVKSIVERYSGHESRPCYLPVFFLVPGCSLAVTKSTVRLISTDLAGCNGHS